MDEWEPFWLSEVPTEVVLGLHSLTSVPPHREEYEVALQALGWSFIKDHAPLICGDFFVRVNETLRLWVMANQQDEIFAAILHFCSWFEDHPSQNDYLGAREPFETAYSVTEALTTCLLGPPERQGACTYGADAQDCPDRFSIWRGTQALLVLQQCDFDHSHGLEVNFWVQPWPEDASIPQEPPLEWLEPLCCGRFTV